MGLILKIVYLNIKLMKMKKRIFYTIAFLLFFLTVNLWAQPEEPPSGPDGGGEPPCWPPQDCIPADSGIIWMIVGGSLLAIYKIYQINNKDKAI